MIAAHPTSSSVISGPFDQESLGDLPKGMPKMVDTAGEKVKVERRGPLFAAVEDEEGNSTTIRAPALLVPGLQSEKSGLG